MKLPFTFEEFLAVFREYNARVGYAPWLLTALALMAVALAFTKRPWRHRAIGVTLAGFWIWAGAVYHWAFFSRINGAARPFGALFVAQGVLILVAVARGRLRFFPRPSVSGVTGLLLVFYALVVYPVLGWLEGHGYPDGPSFGVPCPVVIFFFGIVLWSLESLSAVLLVIPVLWAAVGTSAALQLGMREDFALPVAALIVIVAMMYHARHAHKGGGLRPPKHAKVVRPAGHRA
jgi:hypothetical protein